MSNAIENIEILVVNLPQAVRRRALMEGQLDQDGMLPFHILAGVDGRILSAEERDAIYDDAEARIHTQRSLLPGEIGCSASHFKAWHHIVDHGLVAGVIVEDDAVLGVEAIEVIRKLQPLLRDETPRLILLEHVGHYSMWSNTRISRLHKLCKPRKTRGSHGYVLNRSGAEALLRAMPKICVVADRWTHFAQWVEVTAVVPYCIGRSPTSRESQIGPAGKRNDPRSSLAKWAEKYLYQKFFYQLVMRPLLRIRSQKETW